MFADVKADGINYENRHIFRESPMEVIKYLAASLDEQPIIFDYEVVFASYLIFLFEFVKVADDGFSYVDGDSSENLLSGVRSRDTWAKTCRSIS